MKKAHTFLGKTYSLEHLSREQLETLAFSALSGLVRDLFPDRSDEERREAMRRWLYGQTI